MGLESQQRLYCRNHAAFLTDVALAMIRRGYAYQPWTRQLQCLSTPESSDVDENDLDKLDELLATFHKEREVFRREGIRQV